MSRVSLTAAFRARGGGYALLITRFAALLAVSFLSLHHWMRAGYWEFSGVWQYGLPLLDPRVPAALTFWLLSTSFWILLVLPTARWFAERIPGSATGRKLAAAVLAIGLGTRGVVGPLLVRAAVGAPLALAAPGQLPVRSWLEDPYAARWLVLLTQAWWVFPLLVAALGLVGKRSPRAGSWHWTIRGLLALFALYQPIDAPYLLTAGGPHGATQGLVLLAFQEGFGRQEFGYASVLSVLLCVSALPIAWLLRAPSLWSAPEVPEEPPPARSGWAVLALILSLPLTIAVLRLPHAVQTPRSVWTAAGVSLGLAAAGGGWSAFLSGALSRRSGTDSRHGGEVAKFWALLFPPLVLVLPMIRPWGYHTGPIEGVVLVLGMVVLAPHLVVGLFTCRLQHARGVALGIARRGAGWLVAWAIWTELGIDVMLSQSRHAWLPLQGWMAWELSTVLRSSPLAVPGWPLAWAGGALLAWIALTQLFQSSSELPTRPEPVRGA